MEILYALIGCLGLGLNRGIAKKPLAVMHPSRLFFFQEFVVVIVLAYFAYTDFPDLDYESHKVKINLVGIAIAGFIGCIAVILIFKGISIGHSGLVSTIANSYLLPVTIILWILGKAPPLSFIPKGVLIIVGILLISWPKGEEEKKNNKGIQYGFYGVIGYSVMFILFKSASIVLTPILAVFLMRVSGLVTVTFALPILKEPYNMPVKFIPVVLLLGVTTAIGVYFMSKAFAEPGANELIIVAIVGSNPMVTIVYSHFFNNEGITKKQFVGVLSTISGIGLPI